MGGGKDSDPVVMGYQYFLGMHLILCHSADALCKIKVDKTVVYDAVVDENEQIYIDKTTIFGQAEGGIQGYVDVEFGRYNQARNTYLQQFCASNCPAFRGVMGIVARGIYIGNSQYLKYWSFYVERCQTSSGWYPETAAIPRG